MRLATYFVVALLVLCSHGCNSAHGAYFLSSSLGNTSLKGVSCGPFRQQCPDSSPICCGTPDRLYCVPAGGTCCTARYPSWTSSLTSCSQGQVCCAGDTTATCCDAGFVCDLQTTLAGVVYPRCIRTDACNSFGTVDSCVHADIPGSQCGWCCEEQRCLAKTNVDTGLPNVCLSDQSKPITRGEQCASRCSYASTCELCEGVYQQNGAGKDSCSWCCATMSCMPSARAATHCENQQRVSGPEQCQDCLYEGHGVNEQTSGDVDNLLETIFSILLFMAIVLVFVVWRVVYECAFGASEEDANPQPRVHPQEAVRRYGFQRTDRAPSSPVHHRPRGGVGGAALAEPSTHICSLCKRQLTLSHLQAQLQGAAPLPTPSLSAAGGAASASGPSANTSEEMPPGRGEPTGDQTDVQPAAATPVREQVHETAVLDLESNNRVNTDDAVTIFLPCDHIICFQCLGMPPTSPHGAVRATVSSQSPPPAAAATQAGNTHPTSSSDDETVEKLLATRWKNKCPFCRAEFEDTIVPDRIISL